MAQKLHIIIGSTRPGRAGPAVARWAQEVAEAHGAFDVALVDLADFALPLLDEAAHPILQQYANEPTKQWSRSVAAADAFIFVTPEYDYFPPASVVNAVQILLREWLYKPAVVVSYGGVSGGMRSAQVLRQLLANVNVHAIPQGVAVPNFGQFIGPDGDFQGDAAMASAMKVSLDELDKWAGALKTLRTDQAKAA